MDATTIKELRQRLGLTAKQLASSLGVATSLVHDWESSRQFPTKKSVKRLTQLAMECGKAEAERPGRRTGGPAVTPQQRAGAEQSAGETDLTLLQNPAFWRIFSRLLSDRPFYDRVARLDRESAPEAPEKRPRLPASEG